MQFVTQLERVYYVVVRSRRDLHETREAEETSVVVMLRKVKQQHIELYYIYSVRNE